MRTLAIDTAGHGGSVALLDDGALLAGLELPAGSQAERLPGSVTTLLEGQGWAPARIELVVVSLGPGSFTGVRVGLAAAQGLAFGLDIPLVGVSNLEILAAWADQLLEGDGGLYVALQDARRSEYYLGAWRRTEERFLPAFAPRAAPVGGLRGALEPYLPGLVAPIVLCGDGVPVAAPELVTWPEPRRTVNPPRPVDAATLLGRLGAALFRRDGAPALLEPLYIRPPDARKPRHPPGPAPLAGESPGPAGSGGAP